MIDETRKALPDSTCEVVERVNGVEREREEEEEEDESMRTGTAGDPAGQSRDGREGNSLVGGGKEREVEVNGVTGSEAARLPLAVLAVSRFLEEAPADDGEGGER